MLDDIVKMGKWVVKHPTQSVMISIGILGAVIAGEQYLQNKSVYTQIPTQTHLKEKVNDNLEQTVLDEIVIDNYSELNQYIMELGIANNLPEQKFIENADKIKLNKDKDEFPIGWRDQRGQEQLYPNMKIHKGIDEMDVVFIGNGHVPYFCKQFVEEGLKPYIISSYHSIKPSSESSIELLRDLRRNPINIPKQGKPILIIGDTHGSEYETNFPKPEDFKNLGISKIYFHAEAVPYSADDKKRMDSLKHGFWGKNNLYQYIEQLKNSGISIELNGLEPMSTYTNRQRNWIIFEF